MKAHRYQRVDAEMDGEKNLPSDEYLGRAAASRHNQWWHIQSMFLGMVFGVVLTALIFRVVWWIESNGQCTQKMAQWTPALGVYDDDGLSFQRFNGALREGNKFRGPPSEEVDRAWEEITLPEASLVRLSQDQFERINASEYAAKYTDEMGGGYIAGVEVLHQLHCVNMLRQATNMDYYLPRIDEWKDRKTLRYHLDHCLDMLRQKLMCDPDMGMITYVWAKGWKQAFPDFNTAHKCRDYSAAVDWIRANSVHGRNISDIRRAPGALERDTRP